MQKIIKPILLTVAVSTVLVMLGLVLWYRPAAAPPPAAARPTAPSRMLELGPVGTGIESTEQIDGITITMTAGRLSVKKTKTFGFDNNLFKKLAAKEFTLAVAKGERRIIALSTPFLEMPIDQSTIVVRQPTIVFPADLKPPESVTLDKKNKLLILRYARSEEVWDLTKE